MENLNSNKKSAILNYFESKNYLKLLLTIVILFVFITSINPPHPQDFILEHILTVFFIAFLILTYKRFPLSHISYTLIFVFFMLHIVGARYTYAEVPYDSFFYSIFGFSIDQLLGFDRNHYDRLVHFSFGLLIAYPVREFFLRVVNAKGFWGYYLPLDVMMSLSMVYELLEWLIAITFGGDTAASYLGSQGDIWDAQKDMGLASLGGLITMVITAIINWRFNPKFETQIEESLEIKRKAPLGEVELERMIEKEEKRVKKSKKKKNKQKKTKKRK